MSQRDADGSHSTLFSTIGNCSVGVIEMSEEPGSFEVELAKAVGEIGKETARDVRKIFGHVFGKGALQVSEAISDQLEFYKFRNQVRLILKAERLVKDIGIDRNSIKSLSFAEQVRILDAASLEDEDEIQNLWAHLTVNAMIENSGVHIRKSYCDLLKSISPIEAMFLNILRESESHLHLTNDVEIAAFEIFLNKITKEWRSIESPTQETALQNLVRLRCISFRPFNLSQRTIFYQLPHTISASGKGQLVDGEGLKRILDQLYELVAVTSGARRHDRSKAIPITRFGRPTGDKVNAPELNYMLTSLGNDLMNACRKPSTPNRSATAASGRRAKKK
jgi:hypothetical protein